jgi:hypothetical protein
MIFLRKSLPILGLAIFVFLIMIALAPSPASAALREQQATPTLNPNLSIGNDTCLECHGKPDLTMKLDNGDELSLYMDPQEYAGSIHGKDKYACVQCHTTVGNYPHPAFTAADRRDASLKLYPACYRCHSGEYERSQDSVHAQAMAAGNRQAAVCTDCHTAHAVRPLIDTKTRLTLPDARTWIPQTCAQCHNAIFQEYQTSVHGSALLGEGNPDVPTCIDCHGVHNISNPLVNAFRINSPEMCAKCHTDPKRMAKYGISTQVLNTYVSDFHGTTVTLFEKESPDAPTNKPVCFDCHGVHNIARIDDPQRGLQIKENILARCKVCHPDATANFPSAWLSHYIPSAKNNSLVFYVGWFYKLFIPVVLGGMAIFIVMDFGRTMLNRSKKSQPVLTSPLEERAISPKHEPVQAGIQPAQEAPPILLPNEETEPVNQEQASAPGEGERPYTEKTSREDKLQSGQEYTSEEEVSQSEEATSEVETQLSDGTAIEKERPHIGEIPPEEKPAEANKTPAPDQDESKKIDETPNSPEQSDEEASNE